MNTIKKTSSFDNDKRFIQTEEKQAYAPQKESKNTYKFVLQVSLRLFALEFFIKRDYI